MSQHKKKRDARKDSGKKSKKETWHLRLRKKFGLKWRSRRYEVSSKKPKYSSAEVDAYKEGVRQGRDTKSMKRSDSYKRYRDDERNRKWRDSQPLLYPRPRELLYPRPRVKNESYKGKKKRPWKYKGKKKRPWKSKEVEFKWASLKHEPDTPGKQSRGRARRGLIGYDPADLSNNRFKGKRGKGS